MPFFGKSRSDPDEIRRQLFDAAAEDDGSMFARLCQEHEAIILEHAIAWSTVPENYRAREALDWYARGLITLARHLAEHGHRQLLDQISGPNDNVLTEWEAALQAVDRHRAEGRFREGAREARAILERVEGVRGSGADQLLPVTLGRMGDCLFHAGAVNDARAPFAGALQLCEAQGDMPGVAAYLSSLYEFHRYLGDSLAAAELLERYASCVQQLGNTALAAARRRQAALVRAGEPLCRVVVEINGQECELDEADTSAESVHFKLNFRRNRLELGAARVAVDAGIREAERGNYPRAMQQFERAVEIDPFDPWPHYHLGATLCYLRRYTESIAAYARTETLAPGFFHVRSDRWLAEQLDCGAVHHDTFLVLRVLLDGSPEPSQAATLALATLRSAPIAPLYLAAGDALRKLEREREAETQYRLGLKIAEEPDVRTRLLLALSSVASDQAESTHLLREAVQLRGNLVASAMAELSLSSRSKRLH